MQEWTIAEVPQKGWVVLRDGVPLTIQDQTFFADEATARAKAEVALEQLTNTGAVLAARYARREAPSEPTGTKVAEKPVRLKEGAFTARIEVPDGEETSVVVEGFDA